MKDLVGETDGGRFVGIAVREGHEDLPDAAGKGRCEGKSKGVS